MALSKIQQEGNFRGVIRAVYPPKDDSKFPKLSLHVEATAMEVSREYQPVNPGSGAYVDVFLTTPEGDTNEDGINHFIAVTGWNGEFSAEAFEAIEGVTIEFYIKHKGGYYNAFMSGGARKPQDFSSLGKQFQSLTKSLAKKVTPAPVAPAAPAAAPQAAGSPAPVAATPTVTAPDLPENAEDTVPF